MDEATLLARIAQFAVKIIDRWAFWVGLLLIVEPYLEGVAPTLSKQLRIWLSGKPALRSRVFRAAGVIALCVAAFQAWDHERAEKDLAIRELGQTTPRISVTETTIKSKTTLQVTANVINPGPPTTFNNWKIFASKGLSSWVQLPTLEAYASFAIYENGPP
jgi:hypothetical protein